MRRLLLALAFAALLPATAFAQSSGRAAAGNVSAARGPGAPSSTNRSNSMNQVNPNRRPCGKGSSGSNCRPCQNNNCYPYNYVQGMYVLAAPTPSAVHHTPQNHVTYKQQQNWGGEVFSSIGTNPNPPSH